MSVFVKKYWHIFVLVTLIGVGAVLRLNEIGADPFWVDEEFTRYFALRPWSEFFGALWPQDINMWPYYVLIKVWLVMFPHASEGLIRLPSAIFSILSIPAVYLLGAEIDHNNPRLIGLLAAGFCALNAYQVSYGQEARSYSLAFLLATLSTVFLFRKKWVWYVVCASLMVHSHFMTVLLLPAHGVIALVRKERWQHLFAAYGSIAILAAPLLISVIAARFAFSSAITEPTWRVGWMFAVLYSGGFEDPKFFLQMIIPMMAIGLLRGKELGIRYWAQWTLLILPILLALAVSLKTSVFLARYFLFVQAYMFTLVATGLSVGFRKRFPVVLTILIVLSAIYFSVIGVKTYYRENEKGTHVPIALVQRI